MRTATGREMSAEQLAEGFLEIAVGNMAEACCQPMAWDWPTRRKCARRRWSRCSTPR
ncbi:5-oxoprolinase [Bordetella pertussis]|nr:5-oxoprolinase [Bordetella pertussis]